MLLMVLVASPLASFSQVHSAYQTRSRAAVAIDCDTALTSDLRLVRRPYRFSDNLFWGISALGFRAISDAIRHQGFLSIVSPGAELSLGKYFTPWISASLNLGYAYQQEALSPVQTYSFHSATITADAQLCLNRLFSRYQPNEKIMAYAIAGAGIQTAFAFADKAKAPGSGVNTDFQSSPLLRAGLMAEWRVSESTSLSLRGMWNTDTHAICGLTDNHRHSGIEFAIGIISRMPNHYASRAFQNCRGNEIYYFRMLEDRLLKDHQRQQKKYLKGKADAPIMAAEQDSILIFPCGYPYLTERQEAKLDVIATRLAAQPQQKLIVDLYPIVSDDPKMTPAQSVQRCEVAIRTYLAKHPQNPVAPNRIQFQQHPDQKSPIENQSIWIHGAILHLEP